MPDGSSGAPRQGWLNTADGFFTREAHLAYDWIEDGGSDAHRGLARLHYPLSRRLWAGLEVPFIREIEGETGFGDVGLTTQMMLVESRDLSLNAGIGFEFPTGDDDTAVGFFGPDVFGFVPQINLWTDLGAGVALRGRLSYVLREDEGVDGFAANVALGQTITGAEATPFGQFTYYLSANLFEPEEGSTFFSLTPGIRTRLAGDLFFLAGVEVPVINRSDYFDQRVIAQFVYGF
ncbi:MAG: transporter [Rhizobiales bacterium]|nr:transporter [Hyphomicrobiales bacterium]